jgi:hypothetical protein
MGPGVAQSLPNGATAQYGSVCHNVSRTHCESSRVLRPSHEKATPFEKMQQTALVGKLTVPDRVLFRGHLKLRDPRTLRIFLAYSGVLLKDFGGYAEAKTAELKAHAERLAAEAGRP